MLVKLIKDLRSRYPSLVSNFGYLTLIQVFSLAMPVITIPYLLRIIGSELYGIIIYFQIIAGYFLIFVNYGFNYSATKDISENRNNYKKLSEIISVVYLIKIGLFFVCGIISFCLVSYIPFFSENKLLFWLIYIGIIGEVIVPYWFFLGIEKMKFISIGTFISKLLFTIMIFIFVRNESDYLIVPVLTGLGSLIGSVYAINRMVSNGVVIKIVSFGLIKKTLHDGFPFFLSGMFSQLYASANKFVVGTFIGMTEVTFYDIGEKVLNTMKVPLYIIGQTIYPSIAYERNRTLLKNVAKYTFSYSVFLAIIIIIFSENITNFLLGFTSIQATIIMRILSLACIPFSLTIIFDIGLVNWGQIKSFTLIRIYSLLIYLILVFGLTVIGVFGVYYLVLIALFIECFIAVYSYLVARKFVK